MSELHILYMLLALFSLYLPKNIMTTFSFTKPFQCVAYMGTY